jgi:3-isopropylmalate/(R)-2-methylmalate dehydratase small subunit
VEPFRTHTGRMAPLDRASIDTDQIIPARYLRRIERSGFGDFLFADWKQSDPEFILNRAEYEDATILVTGPNFGCGSSREHAPWSLQDAGFRVIVASSFADIFRNNCHKIGLLPVVLGESSVRYLIDLTQRDTRVALTVDLEQQQVRVGSWDQPFEIDHFARECLLNGWDDISLALRYEEQIAAYESRRPSWLPQVT